MLIANAENAAMQHGGPHCDDCLRCFYVHDFQILFSLTCFKPLYSLCGKKNYFHYIEGKLVLVKMFNNKFMST